VISESLTTDGTGPELPLGAPIGEKGERFCGQSIQSRLQEISQRQGLYDLGRLEEIVELGWLHAKMHRAHKDEEEKGIKDWIRSSAEAGND
jgi:hypothetical protein